jgi:hypothetical protein
MLIPEFAVIASSNNPECKSKVNGYQDKDQAIGFPGFR